MKTIIFSSVLLVSWAVLKAQDEQPVKNRMSHYISQTTAPYSPSELRWFGIKPDAGFISLRKLEGKIPPFGSQELSQYISKSALPYFTEQHCWLYEGNIWKDSIKTTVQRRKEYGKRYYFTLTKLFNRSENESALPKTVHALADLRFTINQQQQFELLNLLGRYCMKYGLWEEAEKYYRDAVTEHLLTPGFFDYGDAALKLADALVKQEKYSEAQNWIDFAETEFKNSGNAGGLALCYLKEAEIAVHKNELAAAETLLLSKALLYFTRAESNAGRMMCFEKLGQIYMLQKRFSEAKWFFIQQQTLSRILKDKASGFRSLIGLSRVKTAIKDYNLAASDLKLAKASINRHHSPELSLALEEAYVKLYTAQGNKKLKSLSADKCKKLKSLIIETQQDEKEAAAALLQSTQKEIPLLTAFQAPNAVKVY